MRSARLSRESPMASGRTMVDGLRARVASRMRERVAWMVVRSSVRHAVFVGHLGTDMADHSGTVPAGAYAVTLEAEETKRSPSFWCSRGRRPRRE